MSQAQFEVVELFAGAGRIGAGLEATKGFRVVAACEYDRDCQFILKEVYPGAWIFPDIRTMGTKKDAVVDQIQYEKIKSTKRRLVFVGGYPCIGHSIAGKKEGLKNEQSKLWKDYKRLIKENKPEWIIIENSPNLKNTGLERVISDLVALGYMGEAHVLSSCSVGGVSRRERLYIIANRNGFRLFNEAFATEKEKQEWWTKARVSLGSEWAGKSRPSGIYHGHTKGLNESIRQKRIRICGNSLDWRIPYLIGKRILEVEGRG